jgi:hypothetical protein
MNNQQLNSLFCYKSGVKFFMVDSFGINYIAESHRVHPVFNDPDTIRAILKAEYQKAKKNKREALYDADWQDVVLFKNADTEFNFARPDQILSKSFIAGAVLAQLNNLGLVVCKEIGARQVHSLNIALCRHRQRANLIWMARKLLAYPAKGARLKINLDTVYEDHKDRVHCNKHWSDSICSYIGALLNDEETLPKQKKAKRSGITIYGSDLPQRARLKNVDKPLNGTRVEFGLKKAAQGLASLKAAKEITKKQHDSMYYAMMNWADATDDTMARLGSRLTELSECTCLKVDYQTILERVGLAFSTGEIKDVGNANLHSMGDVFLGVAAEAPPKPVASLLDVLKERTES